MSKNLSFVFCIIPNPFASGTRNMIFISKSGDNFLNKKIINSQEYRDVKEILEQFGYTETSHLQFESSTNSHSDTLIIEMKTFLEDCGLSYSRDLEVNIIRDLTNLKIETDKAAQNNLVFLYGDVDFNSVSDNPINDKTKNKLIESKSSLFEFKYQEPEVKEKVTLYFYLFLEFGFNQAGKPIIQFGGDFKDSDDYDDRNYIKIVKSDFERINDKNKPNSIILSSCKTQEDFIREAGILYRGYFKYQKRIEKGDAMILQEKKYPYKLAEVRKFLKPDQSIIIETSRMGYDRLIDFSKKIKAESIVESKKFITTGEIETEAEEITKFLTRKMEVLSEVEEFEEAANMKKDIDSINNKLTQIKGLDIMEITTEEYFKIFSIS